MLVLMLNVLMRSGLVAKLTLSVDERGGGGRRMKRERWRRTISNGSPTGAAAAAACCHTLDLHNSHFSLLTAPSTQLLESGTRPGLLELDWHPGWLTWLQPTPSCLASHILIESRSSFKTALSWLYRLSPLKSWEQLAVSESPRRRIGFQKAKGKFEICPPESGAVYHVKRLPASRAMAGSCNFVRTNNVSRATSNSYDCERLSHRSLADATASSG